MQLSIFPKIVAVHEECKFESSGTAIVAIVTTHWRGGDNVPIQVGTSVTMFQQWPDALHNSSAIETNGGCQDCTNQLLWFNRANRIPMGLKPVWFSRRYPAKAMRSRQWEMGQMFSTNRAIFYWCFIASNGSGNHWIWLGPSERSARPVNWTCEIGGFQQRYGASWILPLTRHQRSINEAIFERLVKFHSNFHSGKFPFHHRVASRQNEWISPSNRMVIWLQMAAAPTGVALFSLRKHNQRVILRQSICQHIEPGE